MAETKTPPAAGPSQMPDDVAQAIRALLAEALVRDYLAERQGVHREDGASPLGDVTPERDKS